MRKTLYKFVHVHVCVCVCVTLAAVMILLACLGKRWGTFSQREEGDTPERDSGVGYPAWSSCLARPCEGVRV